MSALMKKGAGLVVVGRRWELFRLALALEKGIRKTEGNMQLFIREGQLLL